MRKPFTAGRSYIKKGFGIDESSKDRRRRLIDQILSRRVLIDIEKLDDPANFIHEDRKTELRGFAPIGIMGNGVME